MLGASLLAWWDAERADLITESGGAVSSWKDIVGGYDLAQATGASKPTWSATSFGGWAGVSYDGTDDELSATVPASFPINADGSEIHLAVDQVLPSGTAGSLRIFAYGGVGTASSRAVQRSVSGGGNRASVVTATTSVGPAVDFSGRHVVRGMFRPTDQQCDVDGVAGAPGAISLGTTSVVRMRMGATTANAPASFFAGVVSVAIVTAPLTDPQADLLRTYLARRL
jgi:hypothetical protein